jgi:single-strand DNA-binding protein
MAKVKSTPGTKKVSKVNKIGKVNKSVKVAKTLESKTKVSKKIAIDEFSPVNEVRLVGRVTSLAVEKELPSGDKVVEFRVVIGRGKLRNGKKEVDSLDIAAWSAKARRAALAVKIDSWVEVKGSVRRRFWRAPTGLASRWQVEASEVVRL